MYIYIYDVYISQSRPDSGLKEAGRGESTARQNISPKSTALTS